MIAEVKDVIFYDTILAHSFNPDGDIAESQGLKTNHAIFAKIISFSVSCDESCSLPVPVGLIQKHAAIPIKRDSR